MQGYSEAILMDELLKHISLLPIYYTCAIFHSWKNPRELRTGQICSIVCACYTSFFTPVMDLTTQEL